MDTRLKVNIANAIFDINPFEVALNIANRLYIGQNKSVNPMKGKVNSSEIAKRAVSSVNKKTRFIKEINIKKQILSKYFGDHIHLEYIHKDMECREYLRNVSHLIPVL